MSKVKPLIHGLCSVNVFEMGEKSKAKIKKLQYFPTTWVKNHVNVLDMFYCINKGCFWFLFIPVIKSRQWKQIHG